GDATRPEQVAVELEGARLENGCADARQAEVQRVVDGDRTGGEAIEPEPSVAPRLLAGPAQGLHHVLLSAVAEGVEPAIAVARAADLHQQVVVGGAVVRRAAARAIGAELGDHRAWAKPPLPGHGGL